MEYITMITITAFSGCGTATNFHALWIGQEEVSIQGRSISQCLDEMKSQGWSLMKTRAAADQHGILCEYHFQRVFNQSQLAG